MTTKPESYFRVTLYTVANAATAPNTVATSVPTYLTRLARASRSPSPCEALYMRGRTTNPLMACANCTGVKRSMRYTKSLTNTAMKPVASATEKATQ